MPRPSEMANGRSRAASYVRVSQERNVDGYGLDAQQADVDRYVEFMQLDLSEVYREEGISGYTRERPALERMLADARAGRFDVAVFPSIDRIARSVKDTIEIEEQLRDCGIRVVFVREGIDTATPIGQFFRNVMASGVVPMIGTPCASRARASFSGVWPPNCTMTPLGCSRSTISSTSDFDFNG